MKKAYLEEIKSQELGRLEQFRGFLITRITTVKWVWNKTESRRDPRTGRRRRFTKPESEWITIVDESLRIIPKDLWDSVRTRRKEVSKSWPGGKGKHGFSKHQKSCEAKSVILTDDGLEQAEAAFKRMFESGD